MYADYLQDSVEKSLDRLGVEYVGALQLHDPTIDEITPGVLELLDELEEGDDRRPTHPSYTGNAW